MAIRGSSGAQPVPSPEQVGAHMFAADRASQSLGMRIVALGAGTARLEMAVRDDMLNGHEICHGGFIFTLADTAFGYASNTHNQRTVSASCSIDYLAPVFLEDRLIAEASEVLRGGRRGIYDVKVTNQKGETVALFRGHAATIKGKWIE